MSFIRKILSAIQRRLRRRQDDVVVSGELPAPKPNVPDTTKESLPDDRP